MREWLRSYILLMKWNLLRLRADLVVFLAYQMLMSAGVVVGFSLLIPNVDDEAALYLTTGAMTMSLIIIGMGIAPQVVAYRRLTGLLDYERAMPVPRLAMMAAETTIWIALSLPGLAVTLGVATLRFELDVSVSAWAGPAVLLVSFGAAAIGYFIGYIVRPLLVSLVTGAVTIVALMFAPVNYPARRLPGWAADVHEWLPFQYMAQAIRETVDPPPGGVSAFPFVVLAGWVVLGLLVTSFAMTRRA